MTFACGSAGRGFRGHLGAVHEPFVLFYDALESDVQRGRASGAAFLAVLMAVSPLAALFVTSAKIKRQDVPRSVLFAKLLPLFSPRHVPTNRDRHSQ